VSVSIGPAIDLQTSISRYTVHVGLHMRSVFLTISFDRYFQGWLMLKALLPGISRERGIPL